MTDSLLLQGVLYIHSFHFNLNSIGALVSVHPYAINLHSAYYVIQDLVM